MDKNQQEIIDRLRDNYCNISESIKDLCTLDEYNLYLRDADFNSGVEEAKQIRNDFVMAECMVLVAEGDRVAISDYQKMQRQSDDANDARKIRKEFMRVCIELAESKGRCLKEYCGVFNASNKQSEKQYDAVVNEYNLVTPYERSKLKQKIHKGSMSALFDEGKLSEVEMYKRLLSKSLYDSEASEYPSERSKARADVISINQRLDEIEEKKRRDSEQDETHLVDTLDAQLSGVSPQDIEALRQKYREEVKGLEC